MPHGACRLCLKGRHSRRSSRARARGLSTPRRSARFGYRVPAGGSGHSGGRFAAGQRRSLARQLFLGRRSGRRHAPGRRGGRCTPARRDRGASGAPRRARHDLPEQAADRFPAVLARAGIRFRRLLGRLPFAAGGGAGRARGTRNAGGRGDVRPARGRPGLYDHGGLEAAGIRRARLLRFPRAVPSAVRRSRADGTVFSLCPAEDSCGTLFSAGAYFKYAADSEAFWALFGLERDELGALQIP